MLSSSDRMCFPSDKISSYFVGGSKHVLGFFASTKMIGCLSGWTGFELEISHFLTALTVVSQWKAVHVQSFIWVTSWWGAELFKVLTKKTQDKFIASKIRPQVCFLHKPLQMVSKEQENRGSILHICGNRIFVTGWWLLGWRNCDPVLIKGIIAVIVSDDSIVALVCVVHLHVVATRCTPRFRSRNNLVSCRVLFGWRVCQSSVIENKATFVNVRQYNDWLVSMLAVITLRAPRAFRVVHNYRW